jgi:methylmalonyl-CoA/ethylmalonyl-CoA epimerase
MGSATAPIPAKSLDHVSLAVPDLAAALDMYQTRFGCEVTAPKDLPEQGIRMAYVLLGNAKIELMEPLDDASPIANFLERNPAGGIHHFCLTTDDVDTAAKAGGDNYRVLADPKPGHHGRDLFFIHPKDSLGVLIEIEEAED